MYIKDVTTSFKDTLDVQRKTDVLDSVFTINKLYYDFRSILTTSSEQRKRGTSPPFDLQHPGLISSLTGKPQDFPFCVGFHFFLKSYISCFHFVHVI